MTVGRTIAIAGASLAGAKAAEGAREAGFEGRVVLIGDEEASPYERPPLSKAILRGEAEPSSALVHPDDCYRELSIERVTGRVTAIDVTARRLTLADGGAVPFDALVLATGAAPRRLRVPGADLPGVHVLRTMDDALALRAAIVGGSRVAVIGAGWIGSEVAASARQMGRDVVLIDPNTVPLQRVLGDEIGGAFRDLHADHGVDLRLGNGVDEIRGGEAAEGVRLADGSVEAADVVVVGVGVTPRVELMVGIDGVRIDDGVVVDERLETGVSGVYAAGDVANAWHPLYRRQLRVEHWANALNQGLHAGRNAAGRRDPYDRLPYFFSDQYDLGLEYVGHANPGDELVVRGSVRSRAFVAFWHRDGILSAAMHVNVWGVVDQLKALIETRRRVDATRLADVDVTLEALVG